MTASTAIVTDQYGNVFFDPWMRSGAISYNTAATPAGSSFTITTSGSSSPYSIMAAAPVNLSTPISCGTWVPDLLSQPGVINTMIQELTTTVKPGEKVVVCVDSDMTWEQVREIQRGLHENKIPGVVIRGARAGTGLKGGHIPIPEERRVDILARIGEIWERRPDLKLTDLLSWYSGEQMSDEEFTTSLEVHYTKVVDGVHRQS